MRARMAIFNSGIKCTLREVSLKCKPAVMLELSPKGTVPIIQLCNGQVLEESLEIMDWALSQSDPGKWLAPEFGTLDQMRDLVDWIDDSFKYDLDRYKYSTRFENVDPIFHRNKAEKHLIALNEKIGTKKNLFGNRVSLADIAIFPFVRQLANTDRMWFSRLEIRSLSEWLQRHLGSELFLGIMGKVPIWQTASDDLHFPRLTLN